MVGISEKQLELIKDMKPFLAWEKRYRRGWVSEEQFREAVERLYRSRMKSLGLEPDAELPTYSIPRDFGDPETGVLIGYPVHDGKLMPGLYVPIEELTKCHVGVWGQTRWGKTWLVVLLAAQLLLKEPDRTMIFYDTQGELAGLLANLLPPERLLCIPLEDYWKSPLQDYEEYGLDSAIGGFKQAKMDAVFVGDAPSNLWEVLTRNLCTKEKLAVFGPPSLSRMLRAAKDRNVGVGKVFSRKVVEYQHSLINILGNLSQNLDAVFNRPIRRGFTFRDMEGMAVVVDISKLRDPISRKFFISKELTELSLYAEIKHPPLTVVLDEAHRHAPVEKQWRSFSQPILVDHVKTALKYDISYWLVEQNPGQMVHPAIFGNVATHFTFRMPSRKDRMHVLYSMNVTRKDQEETVGTFDKQHCLAYCGWLGDSVLIRTPDKELRDMGAEARASSTTKIKAFHQRFLQEHGLKQQPAKGRSSEVCPELTAQQETKRRIARHRAENPLAGITETYADAGVSAEIGKRHLSEMLEIGWLEGPERMPVSGRSNKSRDCYVVTKTAGKALGIDWKKARVPGKGSLKSRLSARMIGDFLAAQGKAVRYEHVLSSGNLTKAADVAVLEPDGKVMAIEYENTPANAVSNLIKNREAGFDKTVIVCPTKAVLNKIRGMVENKVGSDLFHQVRFRVLKEFAL